MTPLSAKSDQPPLIQLQGIGKSYGNTVALADISFDIRAGEIHGLCGENGAGKSTLIKILGGSVPADCGDILLDGQARTIRSVSDSERAGIAVIHQESVAFDDLNAQDNLFVGREPRRLAGLLLDRPAMRRETRELLNRLGETSIDLFTPIGELTLAQRQMIGIARALSQRCRLLIMDEPTASLSRRETQTLFGIIRQLQREGVAILYVSHRMEEIFALTDRITVFRDGRQVDTRATAESSEPELIRLMCGRELTAVARDPSTAKTRSSEVALDVRNLSQAGVFDQISFQVRRGEVVGMAGLVGAGRSELARAVFGVDPYDSGEVIVNGQPLTSDSIHSAMQARIGFVPEDRQQLGLVLPMSVGANIGLAALPDTARIGIRNISAEQRLIAEMITKLQVKTASPNLPAAALSGGNQQKLVIAKWLARNPSILILDEPTRGVDVGAKAEIYKLIRSLADSGVAVWLISSDLPEVLALSDRILVMREGRIAGELSSGQATQEELLQLAMPGSAVSN